MPDVTVSNHGSIFLFRLHSDFAKEWVDEFVQDDAPFWGDSTLAVETRYAGDLAEGMTNAGLEVA